jgi:AraC-like DNA-binding protein
MRTGHPAAVRTEAHAPWGLRFGQLPGAGFHMVLQGTCVVIAPGADPITLGPGDLVFLHSGREHVLADQPGSSIVDFESDAMNGGSVIGRVDVPGTGARCVLLCGAYQLDVERPHPLLREMPELVHLPARPGEHGALRAAVELLSAEVEHPGPGRDAIVPSLIDALLVYLLRAWLAGQQGVHARGWAAALSDPSIGTAMHGIHEDPAHPWSVASLGRYAGMSRAVFARRFNDLVGEPPLSYLTRWRMTTAGKLLRESDLPVDAVARQAGYMSEFSFARAFKREFGIAPGGYRRARRPRSTRPAAAQRFPAPDPEE